MRNDWTTQIEETIIYNKPCGNQAVSTAIYGITNFVSGKKGCLCLECQEFGIFRTHVVIIHVGKV